MLTIYAENRKEYGKSASRRLRQKNKLPAIVYGGNQAPIPIQLNHDEVITKEKQREFYQILTMVVDGNPITVQVHAVQRHQFQPKLTHIDFVFVQ